MADIERHAENLEALADVIMSCGQAGRIEAMLAMSKGATALRKLDVEASALRSRCAALEKALEPFAKAGQVIDGPFGPALFAEDDMAFQSGCAWSENGERRTITWGDFRRARAALTEAKEGCDGA